MSDTTIEDFYTDSPSDPVETPAEAIQEALDEPEQVDRTLCVIEGCTNYAKPWSGRGRKPIKCEEHAKTQQRAPKSRTVPGEEPIELIQERRKASTEKIEKAVNAWLAILQVAFLSRQDAYCARAIGKHGPEIASSLAQLAQEFKLLKTVLEAGDKWTALALLTWNLGQLGLKIGVHHNVIPYDGMIKFLVPPPPVNMSANGQQFNPTVVE